MKRFIIIILLSSFFLGFSTQKTPTSGSIFLQNDPQAQKWVDSLFNSMTEDERLGQLFFVQAYSNQNEGKYKKLAQLIEKYQPGGLIFFQGTAKKQAELTNRYQKLTKKVPMLIAMDAEWGLGMRLKTTTMHYPKQLMLGAIQDNTLIYEMGKQIAEECKRLGVHINFAPVVDINNNPKNPVINMRSFGEDRYNVTAKGYMYMKGMQDNGVIACMKHFPGHGDTDVDSHKDLPVITHDMQRLDSIEMFPFRLLAAQGIGSVMVAHLNVPAIDSTKNLPTTLSKKAVTALLKEKIGFTGLIFTDALGMKGVTKYYKPGEVEVKALKAGNDGLLMAEDVPAAMRMIKKALKSGDLDIEAINKSVKKILFAKYKLGFAQFKPIELDNLTKDLNTQKAKALKRKLIQNALTLVRNEGDLLPLKDIQNLRIASLSIGAKTKTVFQKTLSNYTKTDHFQLPKKISAKEEKKMLSILKNYDLVITGLHDMSMYARKEFGITKSTRKFLKHLNGVTDIALTIFGNPYSLKYFDDFDHVLVAYEEDKYVQDIAAQAIFGGFEITGHLPVTVTPKSRYGQGINTPSLFRLSYGIPEEVGLNSDTLRQIDELMQSAIDTGATPGGVVLVARRGKVVYHKAYGYHTYKKKHHYRKDDIFDLASVTKIAASTISTMKLHEQGIIDVNEPMSKYLPELDTTNKKGILIKDMMSHHAALKSWIKFYEKTLDKHGKPSKKFYRSKKTKGFTIEVAKDLFLMDSFIDTIKNDIMASPLRATTDYKYSDLAFYFVADMIKRVTGKRVDQYAADTFYKPLGLQTTTFNPAQKFPLDRIPPTEKDKYFRNRLVHGYVHDMGATMLRGVSGHAGLFSDANDLAIIFQMLLNGGYYGGKRYLEPETITYFATRCPVCTRRGIGFDMLQTDKNFPPNLSEKASLLTFGHLGFTGIAVWADPENEILYIFMSNRTYPDMHNNKLGKLDFRPRIQSVIYNSLTD